MSIDVIVDPDDVKRALKVMDPAALWAAIGRGMGRGARRVWEGLPKYPPAPADSSYRRTGELGRRMYVADPVVSVGSASVEIGNNRPGAGWVIGPDMGKPHQAWMHSGRWWQLDKQMEKDAGQVADAVTDEIRRLADSR